MTDIPEDVQQAATRIADKYLGFEISCQALYADVCAALIADRAAQAERMARLEEALSKMRAAVTWISAPFVDENTSHEELRKRVALCVSDAALAARALSQEGSEPS